MFVCLRYVLTLISFNHTFKYEPVLCFLVRTVYILCFAAIIATYTPPCNYDVRAIALHKSKWQRWRFARFLRHPARRVYRGRRSIQARKIVSLSIRGNHGEEKLVDIVDRGRRWRDARRSTIRAKRRKESGHAWWENAKGRTMPTRMCVGACYGAAMYVLCESLRTGIISVSSPFDAIRSGRSISRRSSRPHRRDIMTEIILAHP